MDFKQLRSFGVVVQHKRFTKAPERLFISHATLSVHIRQLEEELGTRLILRTTKSIEVSEKRKEIFESASNILSLYPEVNSIYC